MNSELKWSGTAGLRWVQCTISGLPSPPSAISFFSATYSGSKRRMKPTWISGRPSAASFCTIAYAEAMSVVSGFSQSTGMPAVEAGVDLLVVRRPGRGDQHGVDLGVVDRLDRVVDHPGADRRGDLRRPCRRRSR